MYKDTITVFNRYHKSTGDIWYPKVLTGVDLVNDRAAITAKYGADSSDRAKLHVRYKKDELGRIQIGNYTFLNPKQWESLPNEEMGDYITFETGQYFDFFMEGEYKVDTPIEDDDYKEGFYNFIVKNYDNVFAITSVSSPYTLIKHFEIMGK